MSCRADNLSSIFRAHEKMDVVIHICNSSTPKANGRQRQLPGSSLPASLEYTIHQQDTDASVINSKGEYKGLEVLPVLSMERLL